MRSKNRPVFQSDSDRFSREVLMWFCITETILLRFVSIFFSGPSEVHRACFWLFLVKLQLCPSVYLIIIFVNEITTTYGLIFFDKSKATTFTTAGCRSTSPKQKYWK